MFSNRSNFRLYFIVAALCFVVPSALRAANAPITSNAASGNLTSFSGNIGALNNNQWNAMANPGKGAPAADFGNCNSLILRCASPKCASGGCTSMDVAVPIVNGCVQSNANCKQYGDDLVNSIAAQLVASSNAKANAAAAAANASANANSAAQSDAQMQAMQQQLQQMQSQMADQNAQSAAAVQAALEEQKQLMAQSTAAASVSEQTSAAIDRGVSADTLARNQASGQILSKLEDVNAALKTAKTAMQTTFDYAGCDSSGSGCRAPTRVAAFKEKAGAFFDPYNTVLDEVYDALIQAQALGVDITDIYMMLNGSCNVWGKYLCEVETAGTTSKTTKYYELQKECPRNNCRDNSTTAKCLNSCNENLKISSVQPHCQLLQMLSNQDDVQQNWLDMDRGSSGGIRVACASDALDNSKLFAKRKKQSGIDSETLQLWIEQEAQVSYTGNKAKDDTSFCFGNADGGDLTLLQQWATKKSVPSNKMCVNLDNDGKIKSNKDAVSCTDDETTSQAINPKLALCSIHIYNTGDKNKNPDNQSEKETMNNVIALKTTLIAQQMKKQYDFLDVTVKRFQTQLQKAVLVAQNEAAGASSGNGSSSSGTDNGGITDCRFKDQAGTIYCVRDNLSKMNTMVSSRKWGDLKKAVKVTVDSVDAYLITNKISAGNKCAESNLSTADPANACLNLINAKLYAIEQSSQQRSQQTK